MKTNNIKSAVKMENVLSEQEKSELLGGTSQVARDETASSAKSEGLYCGSQSGTFC